MYLGVSSETPVAMKLISVFCVCFLCFFTGRATAGTKITQQAI